MGVESGTKEQVNFQLGFGVRVEVCHREMFGRVWERGHPIQR